MVDSRVFVLLQVGKLFLSNVDHSCDDVLEIIENSCPVLSEKDECEQKQEAVRSLFSSRRENGREPARQAPRHYPRFREAGKG